MEKSITPERSFLYYSDNNYMYFTVALLHLCILGGYIINGLQCLWVEKDKYTNYDSGLTFNPTLSAWWILNDWTLNKWFVKLGLMRCADSTLCWMWSSKRKSCWSSRSFFSPSRTCAINPQPWDYFLFLTLLDFPTKDKCGMPPRHCIICISRATFSICFWKGAEANQHTTLKHYGFLNII